MIKMLVKMLASHVLYHENTPEDGGEFSRSTTLAKGETAPLPFDPSSQERFARQQADDAVAAGQAALSVVPAVAKSTRKAMPWRGRKRAIDPLSAVIHIRCTPTQHTAYEAAAAHAGLSVGEYFRKLSGAPGPRPRAARRPAIEKTELARLLGLLGNLTSNVNQLSRAANTAGFDMSADELKQLGDEVRGMRAAVMKALGYGD